MHRSTFMLAVTLCFLPCLAPAQSYPQRPVRMLVGWAPGGTVDLIGRMVAQRMTETLHQTVIVDNRPGASGTIADLIVAGAAADGYTLQTAGSTHATNPSLYPEAKFHPVKDFTPIVLVASTPYALVTGPKLTARTITDFRDWAKKRPDPIVFGSAGLGSRQHLSAILLTRAIGARLTLIPYKGSGPAMAALLGGEVPVLFENVAAIAPHVSAGRMRALAVTTARRSARLPEVPTMIESGFPGFDLAGYFGVYGPPKLPPHITGMLSELINAGLKTPEWLQHLARAGAEPVGGAPASFATFLQADVDTSSKIIRELGITAN